MDDTNADKNGHVEEKAYMGPGQAPDWCKYHGFDVGL